MKDKARSKNRRSISADEFNRLHPIGTRVVFRSTVGGVPMDTRTTSEAWELGHGAVVVCLEGRSGGCSVEPEFMEIQPDEKDPPQ